MDTSRVSLGEMVAAAGGLVLLVCMFLPWFSGERSGRGGTVVVPTKTGWESFSGVFDILIVVLASVSIVIAVAKANDSLLPLPLEEGALVMLAGALLLVILGLRLIDPPDVIDVEIPGLELDTTRKLAALVALAAAAAIATGGYLQRSVRRVGFEPTSP